ncbi:MAG: nuclear transport factor 2 family protein [Rhodospirillaceae bacterium]|jgi:ketosteroid isomerase-like protein|nr:nuclear transport factor 2 family protein [Rhodospirillaceae bacterium]MBT5812294.1 nuclear transport factor 2 family protein [Rhodospirillaceae bacterium]
MEFEALLKDFTTAVETNDGAKLGALFAEDSVYNDGFYGPFRGPDAIAKMLNEHFWGTAKGFKWDMRNPVCDGEYGYAQYVFSYTSTVDGAVGKRVVFEGFGQFHIVDGKIQNYAETFDTGIALSQIDFPADRLTKFLGKAAARLREKHAESPHLKGM